MAIAIQTSFVQQMDNNGDPLNGGTVTVYDAGTTTSRNIYSDTALSVAASNPITLDSAGRHGMLYTAATAYKLVVKNSSGTTLYTLDNIDPGVPLGSGVLQIANGGTGGATAAAALASLGAVSASDISDLEEQVASLAGAAASSEKTQIATGTTAQRPTVPESGQFRRNTTIPQWEGYNGSGWKAFFTEDEIASTAQVAAASSNAVVVTPGRMNYHPGIIKAAAKITVSGGTPTLAAGFNISGTITDNGAGDFTFSFSTALANANYIVLGLAFSSTLSRNIQVHTATTSTVRVLVTTDGGAAADNVDFSFAVVGVF